MKNRLYLDVHVLQTVPPSCVNRDDTGSPKTAIYGGTVRSRVSSQAWKSAMRKIFREEIFSPDKLGSRTMRIVEMVEQEIRKIDSTVDAREMAIDIISRITNKKGELIIALDDTNKTKVLMFISRAQAVALAQLAFDERRHITREDFKSGETDDSPEEKERKQKIKAAFEAFHKDCKGALYTRNSIDIALFGRMVASDPILSCDAAAQVAHSISTHTIQNEYDYFTAVDDLSPDGDAGAGHLGTVEFNSSTLYRYATVNLVELAASIGKTDTPEIARGFVDAFIRSMPTGKQNTFANRTLPDMVYVTIRRDQPVNLCGAFEKPIRAGSDGYAANSEKRLVEYAEKLYTNYASNPCDSFAIGETIGKIAENMTLNDLLDHVFAKTAEYIDESEDE